MDAEPTLGTGEPTPPLQWVPVKARLAFGPGESVSRNPRVSYFLVMKS